MLSLLSPNTFFLPPLPEHRSPAATATPTPTRSSSLLLGLSESDAGVDTSHEHGPAATPNDGDGALVQCGCESQAERGGAWRYERRDAAGAGGRRAAGQFPLPSLCPRRLASNPIPSNNTHHRHPFAPCCRGRRPRAKNTRGVPEPPGQQKRFLSPSVRTNSVLSPRPAFLGMAARFH
ncbi:unnamed protein product [Urochloa humidicola]